MSDNIKKILLTLLVFLLLSTVVFLILINNKVKYLSNEIANLSNTVVSLNNTVDTNINNQTSILYKMIGENVPIITPKTSKAEMEKLNEAITLLKSDINDKKISQGL